MSKMLLAKLLAALCVIGFAVALVLAVGFGAHGSADKWLTDAAGLCGGAALLLIIP